MTGRGRHPPPAIRAAGLRKVYPGVEAVRGIDLTVAQGETFGLLGPDGAGKTTTIAMLCTLTRPTAGRIEIAGHDARGAPGSVRRSLGLVSQESPLDGDLTAEENLRLHAGLCTPPSAPLPGRIDAVLDLTGLAARRGEPVRTFSGEMRRRLEIARGLLHRPRVLFLDEPTVDLDPPARALLWAHLLEIRRREETTLFLATRHADEAARCDRVAIMADGRIAALGTPAELTSALGADRIVLRTGDDLATVSVLRERFGLHATRVPRGVCVQTEDGVRLVLRLCAGLGLPMFEVSLTRPSLDDVFLHHTGHGIDQDPPNPAGPAEHR